MQMTKLKLHFQMEVVEIMMVYILELQHHLQVHGREVGRKLL